MLILLNISIVRIFITNYIVCKKFKLKCLFLFTPLNVLKTVKLHLKCTVVIFDVIFCIKYLNTNYGNVFLKLEGYISLI